VTALRAGYHRVHYRSRYHARYSAFAGGVWREDAGVPRKRAQCL